MQLYTSTVQQNCDSGKNNVHFVLVHCIFILEMKRLSSFDILQIFLQIFKDTEAKMQMFQLL